MQGVRKLFYPLGVLVALLLVASACAPAASPTPAPQPSPAPGGGAQVGALKFALILPGAINDGGWNQSAYEGLVYIRQKYPEIVASYQEKVTEKDQETAIRDYASRGYNIIFAHGFEFGDAMKKVAKEFPNVYFVNNSSNISQPPNLASHSFALEEQGFMVGVLAALVSKTKIISSMGGQDIPVITIPMKYQEKGAKYVDPNAKVLQTILGTWEDVQKGRETALAHISQGADVVLCNADIVQLGAIQAAQEKGVLALGFGRDINDRAPDTVVSSLIWDQGKVMEIFIQQVAQKKFEPKALVTGFKEGGLSFAPFHGFETKLSQEIKDKFHKILEDVKAGKIAEALPEKK
jgi:basic membrane protein A